MKCETCKSENTGVYDTRKINGYTYRRRQCFNCLERWPTLEIYIEKYGEPAFAKWFKKQIYEDVYQEVEDKIKEVFSEAVNK